jgi:glycosyltransferase involved in cell wall biosynthesis
MVSRGLEEQWVLSVSVVIPVYNQADLIARTISACCQGRVLPREVIVVNDGSTDDLYSAVEAVKALHAVEIRMIDIVHGGPGRARDAGWRAAAGDIVAFTDADAIPEPGWIEAALTGFASDAIGAVEGKVMTSGVPRIFTHQVKNLSGGRFMTANMFYRRTVIAEVGGFKSRYREDSDLAFSVLESGYEIPFVANCVVVHPPRQERWSFYFHKANRKRFEALLFRNHPETARQYLPRWQPTELLVVGGEILCLLGIFLGVWSVVAGLALLVLGLPKRIAAWLDGRTYSGRDYLTVWVLTLALVPVEAFYHWWGVVLPPQ